MSKTSALEETFAFQLRAKNLDGWVREYMFHPKRRWRFDFYHPEKRLAVEVEGGIWTGGRHTRPGGFIKDAEKYNAAAEMGIVVLRYAGHMINNWDAVHQVERIMNMKIERGNQ